MCRFAPMRASTLGIGIAASLFLASAARAEVQNQFWPELDLSFPLISSLGLLLQYTGTRDSSGDKTQGSGAAYLPYRINENISVSAGYEYLEGYKTSTGARANTEHRQVYDFIYSLPLASADTLIADRTRFDVRDQEGATTYRVRNRLSVSHPVDVRGVRLVPYASEEVFYDTAYDRIDRLQFRLGTTLPTGQNVAWDFYLARQRDTQPNTKFTDAIGLKLVVKY
jgi:hypothetical protein